MARTWWFVITAAAALLPHASLAHAQTLRAQLVASGITNPMAFVQDPTMPNVQFIVQQGGLIRTIVNGASAASFSDLSGQISTGGEAGLLGLAFAPDYATSGRFYVNFTRHGWTHGRRAVQAQRGESAGGRPRQPVRPHVADHAGAAAAPAFHRAAVRESQRRQPRLRSGWLSLHRPRRRRAPATIPTIARRRRGRCSARCCASTWTSRTATPRGTTCPARIPFLADPAVLPETWAFGLRNPWRYSFDDRAWRDGRAHPG